MGRRIFALLLRAVDYFFLCLVRAGFLIMIVAKKLKGDYPTRNDPARLVRGPSNSEIEGDPGISVSAPSIFFGGYETIESCAATTLLIVGAARINPVEVNKDVSHVPAIRVSMMPAWAK